MKTRILHTRIWKDSYFRSLSAQEKLVFVYLLTNEFVNQIWLYEITDDVIEFETGVKNVAKIREKFNQDKKFLSYKNYIYITNANKYECYKGEKNDLARDKILSIICKDVLDWYNNILDRGIDTPMDTPSIGSIIHNTEIISNKYKEEREYEREKHLTELTRDDFEEIANDYGQGNPKFIDFVESKYDDLMNYCKANGKRYKNYKSALRNWVKKDALQIIKENGKNIVYAGDTL